MTRLASTLLFAALLLPACGAGDAVAVLDDSFDDQAQDQEMGDEDSDGQGEDEGEDDGAQCRTALDCDHAVGERCKMSEPGFGVCVVPDTPGNPWMRMGPAGQPPPPLMNKLGEA
jgi:hypothetical protein